MNILTHRYVVSPLLNKKKEYQELTQNQRIFFIVFMVLMITAISLINLRQVDVLQVLKYLFLVSGGLIGFLVSLMIILRVITFVLNKTTDLIEGIRG